jgi:hypothetical protein
VNVSGGWVKDLMAYTQSTVDISGGTIQDLEAYAQSTVNISGGRIQHLGAGDDSGSRDCIITVRGMEFNYPYGSIPDSSGTLTGTLLSGDPIDASFRIRGDASIMLVPEPSSFGLFSAVIAILFARRWWR